MKTFVLFLLLFCPLTLLAQSEEEVISADSPGMATGTGIMPKGKVQWEYGMGYDYDKSGGETVRAFTFCNSLFRYGISDVAELRLELDGVHESCSGEKVTGLAPVILGTKIKLHEGDGVQLNWAMMANLTLPWASKDFRPSNIAPSIYALADHDVTDKLNIAYNAGLEWDGESSEPTTFAALCLDYAFTDKFGGLVESYNYFPKHGDASWNADLGLYWLVNNRVQLDVSAACNLNHLNDYFNVSFGVAWLIN